jgi:hypothetical protein
MILTGAGIIDSQKPPLVISALAAGVQLSSNHFVYSNSTAGTTWSRATVGNLLSIPRDITRNETIWVAVGDGNTGQKICYSYDGKSWYYATGGFGTSSGRRVVWNGTKFLAAGLSGGNGDILFSSSNGITWTRETGLDAFTTSIWSLNWTGNRWIAGSNTGGNIFWSTDGISWTASTNSSAIFGAFGIPGIGSNGTILTAVNINGITGYSVNDGTTWTAGTAPTYLVSASNCFIIWCGAPINKFVITGNNQASDKLLLSSDGINWVSTGFNFNAIMTTGQNITSGCWNGSYFYFGCTQGNLSYNGAIFRTSDFTNYTKVLSYNQTGITPGVVYSIECKPSPSVIPPLS